MNIIQCKLWQKTFQNMWKGKRVFNNGEVLFFQKKKKEKHMIPILSPRLRPQVLSSSSEVRFCDISPTTAVQKLALPESQAKRN
jgi:hypothetical protein